MTVYLSLADNNLASKYLGPYVGYKEHIRTGGNSTTYPRYSKKILDLKENKYSAQKFFFDLVNPLLGSNFAICVIPSHTANMSTGPLQNLADNLSKFPERLNARGCLARHRTIEKLARGGDRSKQVHLDSISVVNAILIRNKKILLIDDVVTTGNSMLACKELLLQAGAEQVWCLGLGKTV